MISSNVLIKSLSLKNSSDKPFFGDDLLIM